ncbi:hypothetical protein [Pedosphaera parvula]|uniref:LTXXQ motif protein n=1 Tax=Pedosphaera parvula (strain Ellin514) TaxID=320771 RepID=B9XCW2_PEDPL|nr:hypothetical protein [Pedosphaera parvula]EEF62308.1 hypothetical protein Cflav_PD4943 [Pedosphaera parvula Ellin514]
MKQLLKNLFFILVIAGLAGPQLRAEDKATPNTPAQPAPKQDRDTPMEKVFAELKVSPEQKEKLKAIFEDRHQKVQEIIKDSSLSREDKHKKFKEIVDAGNDKIKTILTPEQQERWQKMREENAKKLHGDPVANGTK